MTNFIDIETEHSANDKPTFRCNTPRHHLHESRGVTTGDRGAGPKRDPNARAGGDTVMQCLEVNQRWGARTKLMHGVMHGRPNRVELS